MEWCLVKHRGNFTFTFTSPSEQGTRWTVYPYSYESHLTLWSRFLHEKLVVTQLVKKFSYLL